MHRPHKPKRGRAFASRRQPWWILFPKVGERYHWDRVVARLRRPNEPRR